MISVKTALSAALVAGTLSLASTQALAADGAAVYADKCAACHGADGNTPVVPTYPKIGDMAADAIATALDEYRSGARSGGTAAVMKGIVTKLSPEESQAVADYLGS